MAQQKNIYNELFRRIGVVVPFKLIDEVIISEANIMRTVRGHAFELHIDEVARKHLHVKLTPGPGGDTDIDRILHAKNKEIEIQIKTCAKASIVDNVRFGVSLHKTHGEERRPNNLYPVKWPCPYCAHEGAAFPEFLVIQHPKKGILIVPKNKIPEHNVHRGHYADPAYFDWNSQWMDRWDLLGFPAFKGKSLERRSIPKQTKFPKTCNMIYLTDDELVEMLLMPENFRILEMNLKGNLREPACEDWLATHGIKTHKPKGVAYPKYDRITANKSKIQIKGPSKGLCDTQRKMIGVEVMGSHGQGVSRVYSEQDFDYLGFVIDPQVIPSGVNLNKVYYHFCFIPTSDLPLHHKNREWGTTDKLYPNCKFYIEANKGKFFLKPYSSYRVAVSFRGSGPWYIDSLPPGI